MNKHNKVKICGNTAVIATYILILTACGSSGTVMEQNGAQESGGQNMSAKTQGPADGDADRDGVLNQFDKCPDTPNAVGVNLQGCPLDTDGDSVADYRDRCRGTPHGVKVDDNGCGYDEDGDGVANYRDKCADTIKNVSVDGSGCEWDNDNDGVVDSQDLCVGTPPGVKVESMGCHVLEIVTLSGVHFKTGSDQLSSSAQSVLKNLAETLKDHPRMRVEVAGHTDNTGSNSINEKLSQQRAKSALNYLIDLGVNTDVLTTKGYSFTQPVASNDTEEGQAQNRRVEMRIIEVDR